MKTPAIVAFLSLVSAATAATTNVTDGIRYFANPAAAYYPDSSNITNLAARSCTKLRVINGRIYVGMGDYTYNTGPTPIVSVSPQTGEIFQRTGGTYYAGTDAIDDFFVFGGRIYIPGLDPREGDSHYGHFFRGELDESSWYNRKYIPKGVANSQSSDVYLYTHCWDLASFAGRLHFVGYGIASSSASSFGTDFTDTCPDFKYGERETSVQRLADGTWTYRSLTTAQRRIFGFLQVGTALYAFPNITYGPGCDYSTIHDDYMGNEVIPPYLWRYSSADNKFTAETNTWSRILPSTTFDDALYVERGSGSYSGNSFVSTPLIVEKTLTASSGRSYFIATLRYNPLGMYLAELSPDDGKLSSRKIDFGEATWPTDLIESEGKVYALCFSFDPNSTTNIINKVFESSDDGVTFTEKYRFSHRQFARTLVRHGDSFYFAFGTFAVSFWDKATHPAAANYEFTMEHNGEIVKLDVSSSEPIDDPDPQPVAGNWTYNPVAATVSDGVWTFKVSSVSEDGLTLGTCQVWPEQKSTLNLSKPITDGSGHSYAIAVLGSLFGSSTNSWKSATTTNGLTLAELILPQTGLTRIGNGAFGGCTALTNIVNFLPDSVTSLGQACFYKVPAKCDLYALGVAGTFDRCCFNGSGVTSVHFGKDVKTIGNGANGQGAFQGCGNITNIVFHPEGSGITITKSAFAVSATLKAPLVLYGVTSVGESAFSSMKFSSVTFDTGITTINTKDAFKNNTLLGEVHFLGAPPTTWSADYNRSSQTVTTFVPYESRQQWWPYANGYDPDLTDAQKEELIKETGTTFSSTYATSPDRRPLLLAGAPSNPDPDPNPNPNPGQLRLVAPEDGAVYDTIPWQVRTFLDNPELRSEYPDDDIIAAQDTDGNHYVLNAWMTNLLAQASATGSGSPFKWSCEGGTLCDIAVEYSEDEAFTSPIVERYASDGATATRPRFLKTGTAYWWRVRGTLNGEAVVSDVRTFTTQADAPRLIGVPAFNCRDFGGGTNADGIVVRQGLVIRGKCPPARVNAEIGENKRVATAEYYREFFINKLGIRTDLDFRSVSEAQEHQQQYGEIETSEIGINHVFYPITPYHLSLASNREPIRDMFRMLAEGTNYPVYCHCAVGSDRTGTFGVLLDGLLGRTDEHIYNNYELPSFDPGLARLRYCRKGSEMFASLEPRQDGHHMRDVVVDYLLRLGLTRDELKAIRRAFLVFDGPDDYIDNFTSPKAVYDSAARRLTFYCDSDDHTGEGLVVYKTSDGNASWYGKAATNAQQVVFDPSFAKFHPAACSQWFQDMSSLTNISGMAYLDTSRATAFQNMFRGCKKLPSIDFSHFDTRKVAGMQSMFYDCAKLTTLDLSSFDTRSLTVTGMMFYNCSALKTIYVGWGFSVAKVKGSNGDNMFRKASKLKGGCGTACDGNNNIGASYAHIDAAGNPGYFTLAPGVGPLDPADVPQPVFSGSGTSAPRLDAQGRFVAAIGNAVAGGRYRVYATTSLSEPFEPVGEAVSATADGVLEFVVETNGAPSLFVTIKAE